MILSSVKSCWLYFCIMKVYPSFAWSDIKNNHFLTKSSLSMLWRTSLQRTHLASCRPIPLAIAVARCSLVPPSSGLICKRYHSAVKFSKHNIVNTMKHPRHHNSSSISFHLPPTTTKQYILQMSLLIFKGEQLGEYSDQIRR